MRLRFILRRRVEFYFLSDHFQLENVKIDQKWKIEFYSVYELLEAWSITWSPVWYSSHAWSNRCVVIYEIEKGNINLNGRYCVFVILLDDFHWDNVDRHQKVFDHGWGQLKSIEKKIFWSIIENIPRKTVRRAQGRSCRSARCHALSSWRDWSFLPNFSFQRFSTR